MAKLGEKVEYTEHLRGNALRDALGMEERAVLDHKVLKTALKVSQDTELAEQEELAEEQLTSAAFELSEIEEACRLDLNFLAAMAIPDKFAFRFPSTHLTAWQILVDGEEDSEQRFLQFAIGIPRGHAKTTLMKLFILRCILFTTRKFALIVASTEQHAINIVTDIATMLSEPNIKMVFGDYKEGSDTDMKNLKKFTFRGRNITLFAIGSGGAVRGTNIGNDRPDIILMDDIQTKECADSLIQSKMLIEWMVGTLMKSKSPRRCMFIFAGNMFAATGSILRQLKSNPTWIKFISGAILADETALWPELRSMEDLIQEFNNDLAMGQVHIFFAEMLNDIRAGVNTTVDYSKFVAWPWTTADTPQGKFMIIDPSQGKGKDPDVIAICEVYDAKIGVRVLHEEHYSPKNLILKALILAIQWRVYCIAVESMAYQATLLFWFQEICDEHHISGIKFLPIYSNQVSKNSRINSGIKSMQTSEIILHSSVRSLVTSQIADWNPMRRDNKDDILDAISHAPAVLANFTSDIMSPDSMELLVIEGSARVVEDNHAF